MATTQDDIRGWLMRGKLERVTHVIIVCDTFDWKNYPVYVKQDQRVKEEVEKYDGKNMQKVMEIYNLALPFDPQLHEWRAWHL